jgi:methionine aminotransferase
MLSINSKLPATGTSLFTVMSALAIEHNAINLGQGFPDFQMDQTLAELAKKAIADGYNQYAPMAGYMPLRESIAQKVESLYQNKISASDNITITPGGGYAICTAFTTILDPGDEVIVFEPAFDSYIPNIVSCGAKPVILQLEYPTYKIDWDKLKSAITPKTKAIIINSPHNPTGTVLLDEEMLQLQEILRNTKIFLISDEVYEHLTYDGLQHNSVLKYPELFERSFVCFSFGKVYNCTGWKLGYCISPKAWMTEFRKIHQYNAFCCFTPTQVAIAEHLKTPSAYLELKNFMQKKRDLFMQLMENTGFDLLPANGGYFISATYDKISTMGGLDLAMHLTKTVGVATIPFATFYSKGEDHKILRFCIAKKDETLIEAAGRLKQVEINLL